jgi:small-conductance mechanosensitive channel
VGIDITVLSVFGGALGVGIGFGLQKVAANYVSGYTILLDRTVSPGDLVTVDHFYGEVTKLTSRCIIVRGPDGTEAIVPNETIIHFDRDQSFVFESARADSHSRPDQLCKQPGNRLEIDEEAASSHPRVLKDPAPTALLTAFGDNGINLELMAWIEDPERGKLNLNSDLNLALYKSFGAHNIEIPSLSGMSASWAGSSPGIRSVNVHRDAVDRSSGNLLGSVT